MDRDDLSSREEQAVFEAMEAVEPSQAAELLSGLTESLHGQKKNGFDLQQAWERFKRLLERRGYFTSTRDELEASLNEIHDLGKGFDLFDLARGLARYDVAKSKCLKLTQARALPSLRFFARNCACTRPRKEN